ncbi:MAG: hypothetical protein CM1200mP30_16150 [Pseudomonadota bacterium]|nr:MAG: hypothetical protein CM1200mP30_16150 [Pseudomonadota bacterium]
MDWLEILWTTSFWVAAVRIATPLILGTLGELVCERAGVLNLGIEGIMTMGAMAGWMSVYMGLIFGPGLFWLQSWELFLEHYIHCSQFH